MSADDFDLWNFSHLPPEEYEVCAIFVIDKEIEYPLAFLSIGYDVEIPNPRFMSPGLDFMARQSKLNKGMLKKVTANPKTHQFIVLGSTRLPWLENLVRQGGAPYVLEIHQQVPCHAFFDDGTFGVAGKAFCVNHKWNIEWN